MDENAMIGVQCPNCGHVEPDTLAHLKAHWEECFACEKCGLDMSVDRDELLAVVDRAEPGQTPIVRMRGSN